VVDSDSDDGSEVDEDDDAWEEIREEFDDEDSDGDGEEEESTQEDANQADVGLKELLDALEWRFDEVQGGTLHQDHPPDNYHRPTGLRPGV